MDAESGTETPLKPIGWWGAVPGLCSIFCWACGRYLVGWVSWLAVGIVVGLTTVSMTIMFRRSPGPYRERKSLTR